MKQLFSILLSVVLFSCAHLPGGGGDPTNIPPHIDAQLTEDATIVGYYAQLRLDASYIDTIEIPKSAIERAKRALSYVWLSRSKERDSVIDIYKVRARGAHDFRSIMICPGTDAALYEPLLHSYGLSLVEDQQYFRLYRGDRMLNIDGLSRAVNRRLGNADWCASPNHFIGDGDNIWAEFTPSHVDLHYSVGYGDCPAGCIHERVWTFRVGNDGRVDFIGVAGDPPPAPGERC